MDITVKLLSWPSHDYKQSHHDSNRSSEHHAVSNGMEDKRMMIANDAEIPVSSEAPQSTDSLRVLMPCINALQVSTIHQDASPCIMYQE